jgi:hypothetical protein
VKALLVGVGVVGALAVAYELLKKPAATTAVAGVAGADDNNYWAAWPSPTQGPYDENGNVLISATQRMSQ